MTNPTLCGTISQMLLSLLNKHIQLRTTQVRTQPELFEFLALRN